MVPRGKLAELLSQAYTVAHVLGSDKVEGHLDAGSQVAHLRARARGRRGWAGMHSGQAKRSTYVSQCALSGLMLAVGD